MNNPLWWRIMEDCICDISGNISTYDGSFTPLEDCPVHGKDADKWWQENVVYWWKD